MSTKSLYLINPAEHRPGYFGLEVFEAFGLSAVTFVADLATTTVAALVPRGWRVRIADERAAAANLNTDADVIGITGKISQRDRMMELGDHFRARGKLVVMGGPYATLNPDDARKHCDILMHGELEEIAGELFADIAAGTWREEYVGGQADLARSPLPRWEVYPRGRVWGGALQTSRGCPFSCEFCDVIQFAGRKQRHKPVAQVLAELGRLRALGFTSAFLCDDNLTVYRRRAKELLAAIRDWQRKLAYPLYLYTQVSIEVAEDDEL